MLACGFSSVSKETFGVYPCAAMRGEGGTFGVPIVTTDEDRFAEL